ncbi:hypothetical protein HAP48_0035155 [Bradyrhizobium septentrionale]|uniref:Uncharacterized protein n=1 Tax=Bradyrhizobium septentrionale TaxID=1404411 RepID=A0A973W0N1_9BRAD|nr:hypothetical protein [Bradyrhizobium septentrionale]UGY13773.1 hypothetical protein HAP48_0035155 [Bradyrhizobium septentrionale]
MAAFEHGPVPYGDDGKKVRGVVAKCGAPRCLTEISLPVNNQMAGAKGMDNVVEWQFIARKLQAKGWHVGKSATAHRCPDCFRKAKFAAIQKAREGSEMVSKQEPTPVQVVDNTREMDRDDMRLIYGKLNDVYLSDKVGYGQGWTDERVSIDLGVPRAWVRQVREKFFGDEKSNEDIRALIKEGNNVLAQVREFAPELRRLIGIADKIERQLLELEKVLK